MSHRMRSLGESKTRWMARVSSTTPRLEPRWPLPDRAMAPTMKSRISWASAASSGSVSERRSAGQVIFSNSMGSEASRNSRRVGMPRPPTTRVAHATFPAPRSPCGVLLDRPLNPDGAGAGNARGRPRVRWPDGTNGPSKDGGRAGACFASSHGLGASRRPDPQRSRLGGAGRRRGSGRSGVARASGGEPVPDGAADRDGAAVPRARRPSGARPR